MQAIPESGLPLTGYLADELLPLSSCSGRFGAGGPAAAVLDVRWVSDLALPSMPNSFKGAKLWT